MADCGRNTWDRYRARHPAAGTQLSTQCLLFGGKYPEYLASLSPCGVRVRVVEWDVAVLVFLIGYPSPNERERETNKCGA